MPDRLAYDEALLFSATRLKVADPDLKQGKVEIVSAQTALGAIERPWGMEGGFAVVYKFRTRSGKLRALRCFRVAMSADMHFRYERIGPFFQAHVADITVACRYHAASIVVKEAGIHPPQTYPVIEMAWVDGMTLLEAVDSACRRRDTVTLQHLVQQWVLLLIRMQRVGMAHGDLAGVNVMVRPDGTLVLIDYDGVYIPEFGLAQLDCVLLGQPDYQHPQMAKRTFNAQMDAFSALAIYTALLTLAAQPELWATYALRDPQGALLDTNLLFTRQDFKAPRQSTLLQLLVQMDDGPVSAAAQELRRACELPIDQVRFPWQLIHGSPTLSDRDVTALPRDTGPTLPAVREPAFSQRSLPSSIVRIHTDASRRTVSTSVPQPALPVSLLTRKNTQRPFSDAVAQMAELTTQASTLWQICQSEDDEAIAAAYEEISNFGHFDAMLFPESLLQRAKLAQQRRSALARFRIAQGNQRPLQIVQAYDRQLLDACKNVTQRERTVLALACAFQQAYSDTTVHKEDLLLTAYEEIQSSAYRHAFLFSEQEQQRIQLAQQDIVTRVAVQAAQASVLQLQQEQQDQAELLKLLLQTSEQILVAFEQISERLEHC